MKDCFFDFDYERDGYTPCDDYETCDECAWYADVWEGSDDVDDREDIEEICDDDCEHCEWATCPKMEGAEE